MNWTNQCAYNLPTETQGSDNEFGQGAQSKITISICTTATRKKRNKKENRSTENDIQKRTKKLR